MMMISTTVLLYTVAVVLCLIVGLTKGEETKEFAGWKAFSNAVGTASGMKIVEGEDGTRRMLPQNPEFVALNNALNGVTFGDDPGPCPTRADACGGDIRNAPDWVLATQIDFWGNKRSIGEAVRSGVFNVWDLRCSNLAVEDIQVTQGSTSSTRIEVDVAVDDLRMDCFANADFSNMNIRIPVPGTCWFGCINIDITVSGTTQVILSRSSMGGEGNGITVDLGVAFRSSNFNTAPPDDFIFKNDRDGCFVDISEGISLRNLDIDGLGSLGEWVIERLLFTLFQGLIESIICDLISQTAYIDGTSQKGGGNLLIDDFKQELADLKAPGLRDRTDFEADEVANPGRLVNTNYATAMDLAESDIFEAVSVGLNDYLGATVDDSSSPFDGDLVINEAVTQLTDVPGVVEIEDIKETFELDEYPSLEFGTVLTENKMELVGFRFEGLNTFYRFQALDNGFADPNAFGDKYKYTALSEIGLREFDFQLTVDITMNPGEWVTAGGKTTKFRFGAGLKVTNALIDVATYQLLQQENLLALQAGQLFGDNQELFDAAKCALVVLDHFRLSGLQASIGGFGSPRLVNFLT